MADNDEERPYAPLASVLQAYRLGTPIPSAAHVPGKVTVELRDEPNQLQPESPHRWKFYRVYFWEWGWVVDTHMLLDAIAPLLARAGAPRSAHWYPGYGDGMPPALLATPEQEVIGLREARRRIKAAEAEEKKEEQL